MAAPAEAKTASHPSKASRRTSAKDVVHVYLLRGLLNVFSLGMDELADKIRATGVQASVHNHTEWETLADEITAKYKAGNHAPIILIGHSLGADAVVYMAQYLGKRGIPVALLVPFDGTQTMVASGNVAHMMNITQRDYAYARRGSGFHGEFQNIDVTSMGVDHLSIDKAPRLHAMVLSKIASIVKRGEVPSNFATAPAGEREHAVPAPRPAPEVAAKPEPHEQAKPEIETAAKSPETPVPAKPVAPATESAAIPAAPAVPAVPATPAIAAAASPASPAPVSAPTASAPQPVSAAPVAVPVAAPAVQPTERLEYEKLVLPKH
jgi:hypothetical protein